MTLDILERVTFCYITMVLQLLTPPKRTTSPILNEPGFGSSSQFSQAQYIAERMIQEVKNTPELIGILDTIVTDHFQGELDYYDVDGFSALPIDKLKKVRDFVAEQCIMQKFQGIAIDYFMGDAYVWHPTLTNQGLLKEFSHFPPAIKAMVDEEAMKARKFDYVPASTMSIKYNLTDVEYYIQRAQGKEIKYMPDEITHLKLIEFNGEVQGMSGLKALAREIAMMFLVKENILSQLDNGGSPDSIIFLKNGTGVSARKFDRLKLALESFSHVKKAHGNLAVDGDVGVHQLGASLKDMEYRELAMFLVSEFLLATGLPTTRVPFLMTGSGGTANKGNLATDSEASYQKKINNRRLQWEHKLNSRVFKPLGFTIKFRRDNMQDEIREVQATQMRYTGVRELMDILSQAGKTLTDTALIDMLSGVKVRLFEKDLTELKIVTGQPNESSSSLFPPGQSPVTPPPSNVSNKRSEGRKNNATNRGVSS